MPNRHDFDRAAAMLESAADDLGRLMPPAEAALGPETVSGGRLSLVIDVTLSEATHSANLCAARLRDQANECRRRAEICDRYYDDLADYRAYKADWDPDQGPIPIKPTKPYSWID